MTDRNKLYEAFQTAEEARKRKNFDAFLDGFESKIVEDLDRYFVEDKNKYTVMVNNIKARGIRIFRNSQGKHKIVIMWFRMTKNGGDKVWHWLMQMYSWDT